MYFRKSRCIVCGSLDMGLNIELRNGKTIFICWKCIEDMYDTVSEMSLANGEEEE